MKREEQHLSEVSVDTLLDEVKKRHDAGYRLVQIGCASVNGMFEINYSFDKDFRFENLRLSIGTEAIVPSVSGIYMAAFTYENEIADLYGIPITGIAVDFKGTFIRTTIPHAFRKIEQEKGGDKHE